MIEEQVEKEEAISLTPDQEGLVSLNEILHTLPHRPAGETEWIIPEETESDDLE